MKTRTPQYYRGALPLINRCNCQLRVEEACNEAAGDSFSPTHPPWCLPYVTVPYDIVGHVCYRDVSLSNSGQDEQSVPLVMNEL